MIGSEELEMSLLGACMLSKVAYAPCASRLTLESFMMPCHKPIWQAIDHLKEHADLVTVIQWLKNHDQLEIAGGEDYIIQLAETCPSPGAAEHYATEVAAYAERRRLYTEATLLQRQCADMSVNDDAIEDTTNRIAARSYSGNFVYNFGEIVPQDDDIGVPTPWHGLNDCISTRGFPKSQTTIIRAYHKGGKSAALCQSFSHVMERGLRGVYATFADLNKDQIKRRIMRQLCGWGRQPDNPIDREEYDKWWHRTQLWDALVYDAALNEDGSNIEAFVAWVKAEHVKKKIQFICVDYAQELGSSQIRGHDEYAQAALCSRALNQLARQLQIPILIGSQITKGKDGGTTITKGSRVWEERAGWVLTIGEEKDYIESTYSRFGGDKTEVPVTFDPTFLTFVER